MIPWTLDSLFSGLDRCLRCARARADTSRLGSVGASSKAVLGSERTSAPGAVCTAPASKDRRPAGDTTSLCSYASLKGERPDSMPAGTSGGPTRQSGATDRIPPSRKVTSLRSSPRTSGVGRQEKAREGRDDRQVRISPSRSACSSSDRILPRRKGLRKGRSSSLPGKVDRVADAKDAGRTVALQVLALERLAVAVVHRFAARAGGAQAWRIPHTSRTRAPGSRCGSAGRVLVAG